MSSAGMVGLGADYRHFTLNHRAGEYVRQLFCHANTVERFFSLLGRAVIGIYHYLSPKHLDHYLAMATYRYNTCESGEGEPVNLLLVRCEGRLTRR